MKSCSPNGANIGNRWRRIHRKPLARLLYLQGNFVRIVDVKFDDYIQERYCSERLKLDLRNFENCLTATKGIDKVYNLAANMGNRFITAVGSRNNA